MSADTHTHIHQLMSYELVYTSIHSSIMVLYILLASFTDYLNNVVVEKITRYTSNNDIGVVVSILYSLLSRAQLSKALSYPLKFSQTVDKSPRSFVQITSITFIKMEIVWY